MKKIIIKKDTYYDSVFLMLINADLKKVDGVKDVFVGMGTKQNLDLLINLGYDKEQLELSANDFIIASDVEKEKDYDTLQEKLNELMYKPKTSNENVNESRPNSINNAVKIFPESNLSIISVNGEYASLEGMKCLRNGLHVMMFSDNVSVEDEIELKKYAVENNLLMMGPDCGTAIINGVPLCFANVVRRGDIGVVGASGTGLQEVTVLIDKFGGGISQAIGTGGRDLSKSVGGLMMLQSIEALKHDEATKVILVISKPPDETIAKKIIEKLEDTGKPSIIHFISNTKSSESKKLVFANSLEDAAFQSVKASKGNSININTLSLSDSEYDKIVEKEKSNKSQNQKYLRGYYTGGTLCDEALFLLKQDISPIYCNIHPNKELRLADPFKSVGHTLIDLGDDTFTKGRPHPMIDPSTRVDRINHEANDDEIAVVLLDVVLGYGSHNDPAGAIIPSLTKMRNNIKTSNGSITIIASIVGTDQDFQGYANQRKKLEDIGVYVMLSNYQAAKLAVKVMSKLGSK